MAQTSYIGEGSIARVADIVRETGAHKIFLVAGKRSFAASGAEAALTPLLTGVEVVRFDELDALPTQSDVEKGIERYRAAAPDLVVAVGGGHVMDVAKAVNFMTDKKPLVAIPTTAGSGAESTPFAVVYKDGVKTSLEDPGVLPAYAIVDPSLGQSVSREVSLASGLDAVCQAIESLWARGATEESRTYAAQALDLAWPALVPAVAGESTARANLMQGAHLAGKAIAISKTTACHALSYGLTSRFGVLHGLAVAYTMPALLRHNAFALPHGITAEVFGELLKELRVPSLASFGASEADVEALAAGVDPERLGNNPVPLSHDDISAIYKSLL